MLTFFIYLLGTLLAITCLLIILLVLMQRPKQEGLGAAFGAGVTDQIWGSQTTNVLQKGTVFLGVAFFLLSLTLCVLEARKTRQFTGMNVPTTPVVVTPESPNTPASTTSTPFEIPAAPAAELPAPAGSATPGSVPVEESPAAAPGETAPADAAPAEAPEADAAPLETPVEEPAPAK